METLERGLVGDLEDGRLEWEAAGMAVQQLRPEEQHPGGHGLPRLRRHGGGHHRERSLSPRPSTRLNRRRGWRAGLVLRELVPHQRGGGERGRPTRAGPACSPCSRWSSPTAAQPWPPGCGHGVGGGARWVGAWLGTCPAPGLKNTPAPPRSHRQSVLGGTTAGDALNPWLVLRSRQSCVHTQVE